MKTKLRDSKVVMTAHKYILLTAGCFLLAFGSACFVSPLELVTGGVLSIGVIIQHFVGPSFYVVDIVTWIVQIIMLIMSFIFLGKKFTLRTIYSVLVYPALFSLFTRLRVINGLTLGDYVSSFFISDPVDWALKLLAGLAGGAFIGAGVGVCYFAGGSTGGLDVISVIIARHSRIKEAVSALFLDSSLVIIGIFIMGDIVNGIIGVFSAFACALMVQYVYVNSQVYIIADIISSEYETIQKYVHETMEHGTTIIDVVGGYSGEDKKLLRVAFSKRELVSFRSFIAMADPRAFVTFTQVSMINGEGFMPLKSSISFTPVDNEGSNGNA